MIVKGDLHNFGKAVELRGGGAERYFSKPRPVFWEWLFFGNTSPIKEVFDTSTTSGDVRFSDLIFNLQIQIETSVSGTSKEIKENKESSTQMHIAECFGALLAYCFILGIRDLHKFNLIRCGDFLQVIDAEIVLSDILLPQETLLLPHKKVTFELSGIGLIFENEAQISPEIMSQILLGYFRMTNLISENASKLNSTLSSEVARREPIPIRHILRDSTDYKNWQSATMYPAYFGDELIQLKRGDIPYFFKLIGDPALYFYGEDESLLKTVSFPEVFLKGVERDARSPKEIFNSERIKKLTIQGALYLLKRFLNSGTSVHLDFQIGSAKLMTDKIELKVGAETYYARKNI